MNKVKIISDSACDLTQELLDRYDIDYVRMIITLNDVNYEASLAWDNMTPKELYTLMRSGCKPYTTQVNDAQYEEKFREYLDKGFDIVYVACSSGLSASIHSAERVVPTLKEEYPNQDIYVVDSLVGDMSQGLECIYAAEQRDLGLSAKEIADKLLEERFFFHQCGTVDDLKYLKNAGRVKAPAAFFGNLFLIKPILVSDTQGKNVALTKIKTRQKSIEFMADYVKEHIREPEKYYISIIHADCLEDAIKFKEEVLKRVPNAKDVLISDCGWIIGSNAGPTTLNVYFHGDDRRLIDYYK